MICLKCGTDLNDDDKYCWNCGTKVGEKEDYISNTKWSRVLLVLIVFLAAAAVGMLFYQYDNGDYSNLIAMIDGILK